MTKRRLPGPADSRLSEGDHTPRLSTNSRDVAFGVAPGINAAGRMTHPAEALTVFEAALDEEAARKASTGSII